MVTFAVMLLGFLVMIAFSPNIVGAVVPTNWAMMWLITPVLLFKVKIEPNLIHVLGLVFIIYASLSLMWSIHGALALLQLFALASVFLWANSLDNLKKIVIGLSLGLSISVVIAAFQYFNYDFIFRVTEKPSGLFVNSNIFSEITGMLAILIIIYKLWWFIPVTIPGLLVSSRATILGLILTFIWWLWHKSKLATLCVIVLSIIGFLFNKIGSISSIDQRIDLWKDIITGLTLFGHGLGSFVYDFPIYSNHFDPFSGRAVEAHNDVLQLTFELGIGVIPLILITIILLRVNDVHKYPLFFFIIIGMFGFPFYMPVTAFMAAIVAGYLAKYSMDYSYISNSFRSIIPRRIIA